MAVPFDPHLHSTILDDLVRLVICRGKSWPMNRLFCNPARLIQIVMTITLKTDQRVALIHFVSVPLYSIIMKQNSNAWALTTTLRTHEKASYVANQ